jgi:hypothetical protein
MNRQIIVRGESKEASLYSHYLAAPCNLVRYVTMDGDVDVSLIVVIHMNWPVHFHCVL